MYIQNQIIIRFTFHYKIKPINYFNQFPKARIFFTFLDFKDNVIDQNIISDTKKKKFLYIHESSNSKINKRKYVRSNLLPHGQLGNACPSVVLLHKPCASRKEVGQKVLLRENWKASEWVHEKSEQVREEGSQSRQQGTRLVREVG